MQNFGNMRHNSAAPDAFAKVVKVMNHTWISSLTDNLQELNGFASMAWHMTLESTADLIVGVLAT